MYPNETKTITRITDNLIMRPKDSKVKLPLWFMTLRLTIEPRYKHSIRYWLPVKVPLVRYQMSANFINKIMPLTYRSIERMYPGTTMPGLIVPSYEIFIEVFLCSIYLLLHVWCNWVHCFLYLFLFNSEWNHPDTGNFTLISS